MFFSSKNQKHVQKTHKKTIIARQMKSSLLNIFCFVFSCGFSIFCVFCCFCFPYDFRFWQKSQKQVRFCGFLTALGCPRLHYEEELLYRRPLNQKWRIAVPSFFWTRKEAELFYQASSSIRQCRKRRVALPGFLWTNNKEVLLHKASCKQKKNCSTSPPLDQKWTQITLTGFL